MSETAESILGAALDLSESDRIKIAGELLETVPNNDPALEAEIERWRAMLPDEKPVISMRLGDSGDDPDDFVPTPLSDAAQPILETALAASTLDRAIIAEELLASTGPPPGWVEVTEEEMHAELRRRIEECERDPSACIPWEQVRDGVLNDLNGPRL
jgi:putative addiction module component (TIGR02574 family)